MERRLFIIRHGKSSWDHNGLDDIDRPLAERGRRNARDIAERFVRKSLIPQMIYSSPANRAQSTAKLMSEIWEIEPENLQIHDELYMANTSEIEAVVSSTSAEIADLAIFGHNPSFTMYANQFLAAPLENLPTTGVVVVTLESEEWSGIERKHVKGTYVDYPKRK